MGVVVWSCERVYNPCNIFYFVEESNGIKLFCVFWSILIWGSLACQRTVFFVFFQFLFEISNLIIGPYSEQFDGLLSGMELGVVCGAGGKSFQKPPGNAKVSHHICKSLYK